MVAPERPAVDKLLAQKVLVPDIKAAEDRDLNLLANSPLHVPHQPSDLTLTKLIGFPIRRRKPKANEPVAAIVVQVMDDFVLEVFQNPMFRDVSSVCLSRLGSPDSFAQGCKPMVIAVVITAMENEPSFEESATLRSPPDIALDCIC